MKSQMCSFNETMVIHGRRLPPIFHLSASYYGTCEPGSGKGIKCRCRSCLPSRLSSRPRPKSEPTSITNTIPFCSLLPSSLFITPAPHPQIRLLSTRRKLKALSLSLSLQASLHLRPPPPKGCLSRLSAATARRNRSRPRSFTGKIWRWRSRRPNFATCTSPSPPSPSAKAA